MIANESHITILGIVRNTLRFDDLDELVVYSIIQTMTQARRGVYDGNIQYLAEWIFKSEDTARRKLQLLIEKGYIKSFPRAGKSTIYQAATLEELQADPSHGCYPPQNATPRTDATPTPRTDATPLLKVIDESNKGRESAPALTHTHTCEVEDMFDIWWMKYDMMQYASQRSVCYRMWLDLSEDDRKKCVEHTKLFAPVNIVSKKPKLPKYYLMDEVWRDDLSTIKQTKQKSIELLNGSNERDGIRIDQLVRDGVSLVQVLIETPDGDRYRICREEDAKSNNLKIIKQF